MSDFVILDWENDKQTALENGIDERTFSGEYKIVFDGAEHLIEYNVSIPCTYKGIIFKNFPTLTLRGGIYENCVFDNCQHIEIVCCELNNGTLNRYKYILKRASRLFRCKINR